MSDRSGKKGWHRSRNIRIHPATHPTSVLLKPHVCRAVTLHVSDASTRSSPQPAHCVHTWPGTKWPTQYYESLSWDRNLTGSHTSQHIDETGWHGSTQRERCGCDSPLPSFHPAITCPATHSYVHRDRCTNTAHEQTCTSVHTDISICATHAHTPTHWTTCRTQLKVLPAHFFSLWRIVRLLDEHCQLSWQK